MAFIAPCKNCGESRCIDRDGLCMYCRKNNPAPRPVEQPIEDVVRNLLQASESTTNSKLTFGIDWAVAGSDRTVTAQTKLN